MDFKLRLIVGIILFLIAFYPFFLIFNTRKKRMKQLDKIVQLDPSLRQKVRIIKSKNPNNARLNKSDNYKSIIIIIIMIIIGIFFCFNSREVNINEYKMYICIISLVLLAYLMWIRKNDKKNENDIIIGIKNNLERKYGTITLIPTHSKEIVQGNRGKEGNIRNVYLFSYKVEKYNCTVTCYYQEKFIKTLSNSDYHTYDYYYQKIGCFLDYVYDIGSSNLNELDDLDLIVSKLSKTRIMSFKLTNNYLFIMKETVLYGYNIGDSDIDTDDVKLFYDELIKRI